MESINRDVKYYKSFGNNSNYQDIRINGGKLSNCGASTWPKSDSENQSCQLNNFDGNKEIIYSLNQLNKRSTETRNIPKDNLVNIDSDFENWTAQAQSFFKSLKWANIKNENQVFMTKLDLEEIWNAIEYQNKTINFLINETNKLSIKLQDAETKLGWKIKDVQRNLSGTNTNLESLLPIIKEINLKYKSLKKIEKSWSRSPSPQTYKSSKFVFLHHDNV